jgi:hypothetical protein
MSYLLQYFGKEAGELKYSDIESFFSIERIESDKVEFKSLGTLNDSNRKDFEKKIMKTICGMLNSGGGLIIWGAPEGVLVENRKEKVFSGEVSPSQILFEKDRFISSVTDSITPAPNEIRFTSYEKDGKYIYTIEVGESQYSPHQFENVYLMRIDGQTKPAPHHYIDALFKKITYPKLEGYLKISSFSSVNGKYAIGVTSFIFNKSKLLNEHSIYYRILISAGHFDIPILHHRGAKIYDKSKMEVVSQNLKNTLYCNEPVINQETILIDQDFFYDNPDRLEILFSFGGKKSPLKVSKYKLKIPSKFSDPNELIFSMNENRYAYEISDEINQSEQEKMKILIEKLSG